MPGAKGKGGLPAAIGEEEYLGVDRLSLPVSKEETEDGLFFTLCFWIYLLRNTKPGLIIRKVFAESGKEAPLLALDENKRFKLYQVTSSPSDETTTIAAPANKIGSILSDQACPFEKWVHIGCEIYADVVRIHMDGVVVEEKRSFSHSESNMAAQRIVSLAGGDGSTGTSNVQAYVHYVKVMPQAAVTNHYVKNPPLELSLDGSTGASDDHEVEEGGDGVWSVVGGKASCRRNFALDVVLLDALGRSVHKDMELMALLVYADNGTPVEKPKDDAEAPLLTTFDGVEFPSTERPIKLVHGRASFKLKISQLSSKCDNRLFRVCFDSPNALGYPFLKVYSRPIRCVSRNRNSRAPPAASWRRPNTVSSLVDATHSPENVALLESLANSENYGNGTTMGTYAPKAASLPPTKRARVGPPESHHLPFLIPPNNEFTVSPILDRNAVTHSTTSLGTQSSWPENGHSQNSQVTPRIENTTVRELSPNERNSILSSRDTKDMFIQNLAFQRMEVSQRGLSDYLVFKYCLENMQSRASFLKGAVFCRSDQELNDFAKRVSMLTGCQHTGYQICIARKLVQGGVDLWKQISKDSFSAPWNIVMDSIEEQFMQISNSKRRFSRKDSEFLRQTAGCDQIVSHEGFDRLWQWIYPVALSVSSPLVRQLWEIEEPKWIEGMVFREEAEELLKKMDSLKPGTFILRFASSRCWPHPDAGALIVTYTDDNLRPCHKLLSLEKISGVSEKERSPLPELLLSQKELSQPYR